MSQIILSTSYRFLPTFNDSPGAHTLLDQSVQTVADYNAIQTNKKDASIISFFRTDDNRFLAVLYCSLLALQFGLQPLIASRLTPPGVSKSSVVIATEITKIVIAAFSLMSESAEERQQLFRKWRFIDSLKAAAIPATLYAIQNLAVQYGYVLLDSMTFNLLNQTKTLSAAFWLWIILNQPQSYAQLFALLLLLGAALVLTGGSGAGVSSTSFSGSDYQLGLLVVATASLLSGISAALTQKHLVDFRKRHPFFFSAELAIYGIVFLLGNLLVRSDVAPGGSLFSHWTPLTLIPVVTNAFGGLVVGLVTKYAGSVVKGFSLIAGILITGLAQYLIDGKPLGVKDGVGVLLVSVSIYLHSSFPPKKKTAEKKE